MDTWSTTEPQTRDITALGYGREVLLALSFSFGVSCEILWALILGFALSGAVQAVASKQGMRQLLPDDSPRSLAIAAGLGATCARGTNSPSLTGFKLNDRAAATCAPIPRHELLAIAHTG